MQKEEETKRLTNPFALTRKRKVKASGKTLCVDVQNQKV